MSSRNMLSYDILSTVLGFEDAAVSKIDKELTRMELSFHWGIKAYMDGRIGRWDVNKYNIIKMPFFNECQLSVFYVQSQLRSWENLPRRSFRII